MNQKGITLIALAVTIVVMIIIAVIGISAGSTMINTARLQEISTNMSLIQAKAKMEAEKHKFDPTSIELSGAINASNVTKLKSEGAIENTYDTTLLYTLNQDNLTTFGLGNVRLKTGEAFLVDYNDPEVEVFYLPGFDYKGTKYYKLSKILEINVNEEM